MQPFITLPAPYLNGITWLTLTCLSQLEPASPSHVQFTLTLRDNLKLSVCGRKQDYQGKPHADMNTPCRKALNLGTYYTEATSLFTKPHSSS